MDLFGLACLSGRGNCRPASDGSRPHLCSPLCAVHACGDCRSSLDAPDLEATPRTNPDPPNGLAGRTTKRTRSCRRSIGQSAPPVSHYPPRSGSRSFSAARDRLLGELSGLQSGDEAAGWAHRSLPAKNTLIVGDAQLVEDNFRVQIRFSNRPFGVKRFQTIHHHSVDVARGLVLLFGIGTKALPSWDSKMRRNNLWGGLAVLQTVGPSGHTNSPHPSSREGHHSTARWSSRFLSYRV